MVQPNTHARNPIAIDPQNFLFHYKKKRKKAKRLVTEIKEGKIRYQQDNSNIEAKKGILLFI